MNIPLHPLPLASTLPSEELTAGAVLAIGLCIGMVARSILRYHKPGANRLAYLSVIACFSTVLVGNVAMRCRGVLPSGLSQALLMVPFGLSLAAMVLAVVALMRHSRGGFTSGRRSASGVLIMQLVLFSFVVGPMLKMRSARSDGLAGAAALPVEIPSANLRLVARPGWDRANTPELYNELACLVLRNRRLDAMMQVISEPLPKEFAGDLDRMESLTRENLLQARPGARMNNHPPHSVGTLNFRHFSAEFKIAEASADTVRMHNWITSASGRFHQFIFFCSSRANEKALADMRTIIDSIGEINPLPAEPGLEPLPVQLSEWGVSFDVLDDEWSRSPSLRNDFPGMLVGGSHRTRGLYVVVLGMPIPDPALRLREGVDALLKVQTRFADPARDLAFEEAPSGEITLRGQADGMLFQGRGVRLPGRILLALGWILKSTEGEFLLTEALSRVRWDPSLPLPGEAPILKGQARAVADSLHIAATLLYERQDYPAAAAVYLRAYATDPGTTNALFNGVHCLRHSGRAAAGLEVLAAHADAMDGSPAFHVTAALAHEALEHLPEAAAAYARALERGSRDEDALLNQIGLLFRLGRDDEAVRTVDGFLAGGANARVLAWQAQTYSRAGRKEEARGQMERILAAPELEPMVARNHGQLCNQLGDHEAARATAARLRANGHADASVLLIEGWAAHGLHRMDEARAKFEEAARLAPDDEDVKAALSHLAAQGSARMAGADQPLEALALPAELVQAPRPDAASEKPGTRYLQRATLVSWKPGEPVTRTYLREVAVQDAVGVEAFKTLRFPFDAGGETVYLNSLEVLDEKGAVLSGPRREELYVLDAGEATEQRLLHVPVPGLRPGCRLKFSVTSRDLAPSAHLPLQFESFVSGHPSSRELFVILGEVSRVSHVLSNGWQGPTEPRRGPGWLAWVRDECPAFAFESMLPPAPGFAPFVFVGDRTSTWARVVSEYLGQIADVLKPDPAAAALAREIGAVGVPREEALRLVCGHLRAQVQYQAVEFGRRARHPDAPARVIEARHGDCKGQALLLKQMLEACGIEAHLALVHSYRDTLAELPDLDQFNHMVVWLPGAEPSCIDPTDRYVAAGLPPLWPGRSLLVLDPARPRLEPLPAPRSRSLVTTRRIVRPQADAGFSVQEETRFFGYDAAMMREILASVSAENRLATLQAFLNCDLRPRLESVEVKALEQLEEPLLVQLRYTLPRTGAPAQGIWENFYFQARPEPGRRHPFELTRPTRFEARVDLHEVEVAEFNRKSPPSPFGSWEIQSSPVSGTPRQSQWSFRLEGQAGVHAPVLHAAWVDFRHGALDAWGRMEQK